MKELGITKGEWQYEVYAGYFAIQNSSGYLASDLLNADSVGSFEAEHNAELIADAGNTAQKCGLLPSELLQQRDELKEALELAVKVMQPYKDLYNAAAERNAIKLAEAAIKNTDG